MSSALNRLALRIHAVESEVRSFRAPQLAYSSVELDDGTEMGVVEGFGVALAAEDIANGAVVAAVEAQEAADAAAAKALVVEAAAAQAKADAASAATAATAAQTAADQAKADAAAVATEVEGIPAQIATAKSEAITTAAGTAQQKADAAQQAAIDAAALTAQAKADKAKADALTAAAVTAQEKADAAAATAKAEALSAAATDAQNRADLAKAAAINAAATDATNKANTAQTNAINSAAATAQSKADAAKQAAIDAAALDAKAKADAAQSAATTAAAADAKSKADAAKAAAEAAAKTYSDTVSSGAKTEAIAAAAADAKAKADAAEAAAKTAAAADAKAKADAAQAAAIAAAASDAQTKADVAKAAAINAAASDATSKADAAKAAAIAAAATDAQTKATKAKDDAITAAALTAQDKADLAKAAAISSAQTYAQARGTDLVTNGSAFMGDATNFSNSFTYNGADAPVGAAGSFVAKSTAAHSAAINELIPYDPSKAYRLSCQLRQTVAGAASRAYGYIAPYDVGNNSIAPINYMWITGTMTTLAADLKPGDTTIKITSAANWFGSSSKPAGTSTYLRTIQFWNYVDGKGKAWAPGTYTRNTSAYDAWADGSVDLATGTITLRTAWVGATHPAGTAVSNGTSGGSYMYMPTLTNAVVPETWTAYADTLAPGQMTPAQQQATTAGAATWGTGVPPGTAKVIIGWLLNYAPTAGRHAVAAVSFSDASAAQATADAVTTLTNGWKATGKTTIDGGKIETDSITAAQIATDAITANELKAGAVIAGKVAADAILAANIKAGEIAANHLAVNAVIAGKIAADAVTAGTIATGAVIAGKIAADAVTATTIAADAVKARNIEAGAVIAGKLAADAVAANNVQAGAIIAGKLAADAVLANNIQAGAVVAGKLAADAVLATNVAADAILARNIKAGEVTASHMAVGTITAASGVIGSLDASKITVGKITASQMATGTITAASGVIGDIDAAKITVGKITAAQLATGTITAASGVIGSIDAAKITVGKIAASQLAADAIDGKTITGALIRSAASGPRVELTGGGTGGQFSVYTASPKEISPGGMTYYGGGGYNGVRISNSVFQIGTGSSYAPQFSLNTDETDGTGDIQLQTNKTWVYAEDSTGAGLAGEPIGSKVCLEAKNNAKTDQARISLFGEGDPYVDSTSGLKLDPGISLYTPRDLTADAKRVILTAADYSAGQTTSLTLSPTSATISRPLSLDGEDWVNPTTLMNGWSNYGAGGYQGFGYRKMPDGSVRLRGLIKGGTVGAQGFFTLPPGFRPSGGQLFLGASSGGIADIRVFASGVVAVYDLFSGTNASVSLGMITFMPA